MAKFTLKDQLFDSYAFLCVVLMPAFFKVVHSDTGVIAHLQLQSPITRIRFQLILIIV